MDKKLVLKTIICSDCGSFWDLSERQPPCEHLEQFKKILFDKFANECKFYSVEINCEHQIVTASNNRLKCTKCSGCFCF